MQKKYTTRLTDLHALLRKDAHFSFAQLLLKEHPSAEVFLVGGAVRDALLGIDTQDYDFVVRGVSMTRLQKSLRPLGKLNLVGRRFGVLKFNPDLGRRKSSLGDLEPLDIALPRKEFSLLGSGHYRDFKVEMDSRLGLDADLARRDFTVNAMALNVKTGELVDPYSGFDDLRNGVVRAVGNPLRRFEEDYSRMLRALRFACRLGFEIEQETAHAIQKEMKKINKKVFIEEEQERVRVVPFEVIASELLGTFEADALHAMDLYDEFGVFSQLMPEVLDMKKCPQPRKWHAEGDVWEHTRRALASIGDAQFRKEFGKNPVDVEFIMSVFFHDIAKPACLKTPKKDGVDRVRHDGHDRVGAKMTKTITERLRLASAPGYDVDPDRLHFLVHYHLLCLHGQASDLKNTTIEKYFFRDPDLGKKLMMLFYCDARGCERRDGGSTLGSYTAMKKRIALFKKTAGVKREVPKPILNGNDLMKLLKIPPGPEVGALLEKLREEQLAGRIKTKTEAKGFIKKTRS